MYIGQCGNYINEIEKGVLLISSKCIVVPEIDKNGRKLGLAPKSDRVSSTQKLYNYQPNIYRI